MEPVEIVVLILLFIWSILMIVAGWNNHGKKRIYENPKRKMKCSDIAAIRKYRITLAFYREYLKDFEWVNTDIKSIKKGSFIQCNKN